MWGRGNKKPYGDHTAGALYGSRHLFISDGNRGHDDMEGRLVKKVIGEFADPETVR